MENDAIPDDLITTLEARRLMRCDLSTIYRWTNSGRLRCWKRVGRRFVSKSELLALLQPVEPRPKERAPRRQAQATAAQRAWVEREADRLGL